ncbi:MAG: dihydrofolate reductase [Rhodothermales bacterium]|nr:dihydrofolate reductase [Rhodothermales bacterium]MBO6778524.1 dihydrofolate reductase [Rhodothermales bacterium]
MNRPEIVIVAAVAEKDRLIGNGMQLPWHIPEDLKHFKRLTMGKPMVMGRKTFQSLVEQFGGPLPGRRHLVVTRNSDYTTDQADVFHSIDDAVAAAGGAPELIIAGGASIYAHFLDKADRMELTLVEGDHDGDTYFPKYNHFIGTRYRIANTDRRDGFRFITFVRR